MSGRDKGDVRPRLASGRQLWRSNALGRLRVVDDGLPISSKEAKVLIAAEFQQSAQPTERTASVEATFLAP